MFEFLTTRLNSEKKKIIAIIIAVLLLIVLIILGARGLVKNQSQSALREAAVEKISDEVDNSLVACRAEKKPERCEVKKVEAAALQTGAAELCDKLESQSADSCVWRVARQKKDAEVCDFLSEESGKKQCQDSIWRTLAGDNLDLSWCEKINSDLTKARCVKTVSYQIAGQKGCDSTGIDQGVCISIDALTAAVATEDPAQCWLLTNTNDQSSCLDSIGVGDKDHDDLDATLEKRLGTSDDNSDSDVDGLFDFEEYKQYGTDPAKADTDGDGYNDGLEISGGYNPLGSGRL